MDQSITHIRPRFKIEVTQSAASILTRVAEMINTSPENIKGKIVDEHVVLDIIGEEVHYWTPQLNFRIEEDEYRPGTTIVSGVIGPRPPVWTLFMFIYFSIGIIGLVVSTFGLTRILLGEYSHLILGFPIAVLIMLTAYKAGKYGESLAKDQIELLKQFVRDALELE